MKSALPILAIYKCPYCGRTSERHDDIYRCAGMCHLASLIDDEFLYNDEWTPPLPLNKFKEWSKGDRAEFARRFDHFAQKYYSGNSATNSTHINSAI